ARFQNPSEPWEFADGCDHLFDELCTIDDVKNSKHPVLAKIESACRVRHYALHPSFIQTVLERLPGVADSLGKRLFKPYLEELMDVIFFACESENALCRAAAEKFVSYLNGYLGPSIWRGRVAQYDAKFVPLVEQILDKDSMMDADFRRGGDYRPMAASIPIAMPQAGCSPSSAPSLGGTPT
ncbi:MAG: hypothetical protein AAF330_08270, partial [Pseudomonadota bacterium]